MAEKKVVITFDTAGELMTYRVGVEPTADLNLSKLSAKVRHAAMLNGFRQALGDTVANRTKLGWTDAQSMAQMRRRASAWVNDSWTMQDRGESDYHDMCSAIMVVRGYVAADGSLDETYRPSVMEAVSKKDDAWRASVRKKYAVEIAAAKLARLQSTAAGSDDATADLLGDL